MIGVVIVTTDYYTKLGKQNNIDWRELDEHMVTRSELAITKVPGIDATASGAKSRRTKKGS